MKISKNNNLPEVFSLGTANYSLAVFNLNPKNTFLALVELRDLLLLRQKEQR